MNPTPIFNLAGMMIVCAIAATCLLAVCILDLVCAERRPRATRMATWVSLATILIFIATGPVWVLAALLPIWSAVLLMPDIDSAEG